MSRKSKLAIAIFILLVLLAIFVPGYSKLQKLKSAEEDLTQRQEELKIENTKLSKQERGLKEDPFYIEKIARENMKATKKGEVIYKVIDEDATGR